MRRFFSTLTDVGCGVSRNMLLNFDQTMHLYDPSRGFTWEKKGSTRVQIAESKDGFTLLPVVSMEGFVGAQLIFGGTTERVFPDVPRGSFLHYLATNSHWSNEDTTIKLWRDIIHPYIIQQRREMENDKEPALVLADAYGPHWTSKVQDVVKEVDNVAYVCVPDSLTHLFQPLDLGIIGALKSSVMRRRDDFLEQEVAIALREKRVVQLSKSRPILRNRVVGWIKEVIADPLTCGARCCTVGFQRAGIAAALYGELTENIEVEKVSPGSLPKCSECGELGTVISDLPVCGHFTDVEIAVLCVGCLRNHKELCAD